MLLNKDIIKHIQGIGPVRFVHSNRAKRINISIRPDCGVRVAVPRGVSFLRAQKLITTKHDWIIKHREKLKAAQNITVLDRPSPIETLPAKIELTERTRQLAEKYGFHFNRITIRNQKTRWGSCSATNNINLNIRLIKLPEDLRDYVILHELVHTRVKNHSPKFWQELDYYVGNAKLIDKQLKRFKIANF